MTIDPTEIIKSPRLEIANRVGEMDTNTLIGELERALTVTAETIAYLGAIWRELDRRGVDLTAYRVGMGQYLPLIASGQLDPSAVVRFAGRLTLLRAVQTLPVDEQASLAAGRKVAVASMAPDGTITVSDVDPDMLTGEQLRLVFDTGRIRGAEEQANMLRSASTAARRRQKEPTARRYKIKVSQDRKVVRIGRMTVPVDELLEALQAAGVKVE